MKVLNTEFSFAGDKSFLGASQMLVTFSDVSVIVQFTSNQQSKSW
jgi:hypothetical protein